MRKAQGLSMNTIIIAALALLVLTVLAMVFMSRSNIFVAESAKCETKGGSCVNFAEYEDSGCPEGMVKTDNPNMQCREGAEDDYICCVSGEEIET